MRSVAAVGVAAVVFTVFFLDRVLQRPAELIIEAKIVHEEDIFMVFSQGRANWCQRFVEQNLETHRVSFVKSDVLLNEFQPFLHARAVLTGNPGN